MEEAPVLYPNHPKVGLRWLARQRILLTDYCHKPKKPRLGNGRALRRRDRLRALGHWSKTTTGVPLQWASRPFPLYLETSL